MEQKNDQECKKYYYKDCEGCPYFKIISILMEENEHQHKEEIRVCERNEKF